MRDFLINLKNRSLFWFGVVVCGLSGIGIILVAMIGKLQFQLEGLLAAVPIGLMLGALLCFPVYLVVMELTLLLKAGKDPEIYERGVGLDTAGIILAPLYSVIMLEEVCEVILSADWTTVLHNAQIHQPIYSGAKLTFYAIIFVGLAGYLLLRYMPLRQTPPLILVLSISAMYLADIELVFWGIQFMTKDMPIVGILLILVPVGVILVTARTIQYKVWEWKVLMGDSEEWIMESRPKGFLYRSSNWPVLAFLLAWPLLGIIIAVLTLFGQEPTAVIKAFTETSDWALSQRVAPQNIYYDEHYLCTVAAGGHEKVVKPKRLGVRHGHQVIVNRQLCVANAFEQILEEKTPGFHRALRHFYDTYGFPIAKAIRSKFAADVVYFIMKPLEYIFLIVLYLTDANPENRIALQYTGKGLKDFDL